MYVRMYVCMCVCVYECICVCGTFSALSTCGGTTRLWRLLTCLVQTHHNKQQYTYIYIYLLPYRLLLLSKNILYTTKYNFIINCTTVRTHNTNKSATIHITQQQHIHGAVSKQVTNLYLHVYIYV
eukprot:GHVQ01041823.1.p1 GENE.GHVQ01041823.1~~GHVQ01041823.1.p1  ORF type:complete len:125 (-),score=7.01 GHVQ01041823.1:73-447(-)